MSCRRDGTVVLYIHTFEPVFLLSGYLPESSQILLESSDFPCLSNFAFTKQLFQIETVVETAWQAKFMELFALFSAT